MNMKKLLVSAAAGAIVFGSSVAAVFAVGSNGSFESGPNPGIFLTLPAGSTAIDDWTVDSGNIDYIGTYWTAQDGDRSLDLNGTQAGAVSQELTTTAGAVYDVSFYMSGNPAGGPSEKIMTVNATGGSPENYSYNTATNGNTLADMKWIENTYTFTATGTATDLSFGSTIAGSFGPALDNVVITQKLPVNKDECKKDGWKSFGVFKNQGDCVSYVATNGSNLPANQ